MVTRLIAGDKFYAIFPANQHLVTASHLDQLISCFLHFMTDFKIKQTKHGSKLF